MIHYIFLRSAYRPFLLAGLTFLSIGFVYAKTNVNGCADKSTFMQQAYVKQFDMPAAAADEVYLTYEKISGQNFVKAVHNQNCSPKGCSTVLFSELKDKCPVVALLYTGELRFAGPAAKNYAVAIVDERTSYVDGKSKSRSYAFDTKTLTYKEKLK